MLINCFLGCKYIVLLNEEEKMKIENEGNVCKSKLVKYRGEPKGYSGSHNGSGKAIVDDVFATFLHDQGHFL